ncbi:MAG: dipicolinate synthase subunit DpsA [Oscillospiraceae bacterium]|nr:dipicolinate synthase subunit DpsA [Oscillospiraceae bacterium]
MARSFAIIGGDMRQSRLARLLLQDGHTVYTWALECGCAAAETRGESMEETAARARCVIWPVPMLNKEGALNVTGPAVTGALALRMLRSDQIAAGGRIPLSLIRQAEEGGIDLVDYTAREDFAIANAVPTAEGALHLAIEQTETTLHASRCLIIGYGRIGKALARSLGAIGARVTVSARRVEDFMWCEAWGYPHMETGALDGRLAEFDIVFNTAPHMVLGDGRLRELKAGCLVIDLASAPGGVDFAAAKRRGVNCHWALSLPGKTAPETAAAILRDTIYHILDERDG